MYAKEKQWVIHNKEAVNNECLAILLERNDRQSIMEIAADSFSVAQLINYSISFIQLC